MESNSRSYVSGVQTKPYCLRKATKNKYRAQDEDIDKDNIKTRRLKKFSLGCKNLNHQAKSSRLKTMDTEAVL